MNSDLRGPAYRIETQRLIIRCWSPRDAPDLQQAVGENLDHLRPWMPWVEHEPESVADKIQRMRQWRGRFDLGQDFFYGIFDRGGTHVMGGAGLHPRIGPGALEIGYWIHKNSVRQGYATEVAAALTRVGFTIHEVDRIEIRCHSDNVASAGVPRKLGFSHEATLRRRQPARAGQRHDLMIWTQFRDEFADSPAAAVEVHPFDVIGNPFD